jgi:hypothetical protein
VAVYGESGPEVKILAYSSTIGDALAALVEEYEPKETIRDYDIKIKKVKDGPNKWDVKYSAVRPSDNLWQSEYDDLKSVRIDLEVEATPASIVEIAEAMKASTAEAGAEKANVETVSKLKTAIKTHGEEMTLEDFGHSESTITEAEAQEALKALA